MFYASDIIRDKSIIFFSNHTFLFCKGNPFQLSLDLFNLITYFFGFSLVEFCCKAKLYP